jgi:uncharacterized protein (TIGR00725 family)
VDTSPYVAVIGAGNGSPEEHAAAEEVGRLLGDAGAVLVCGGLGGVMEAASRGAAERGGKSVGILPGETREGGNPHLTVAIATGLGETRNALVVRAADVVIAVGGGFGTLGEIGLALRMGKRVVGLGTWNLDRPGQPDPLIRAATPADAVSSALEGLPGKLPEKPTSGG